MVGFFCLDVGAATGSAFSAPRQMVKYTSNEPPVGEAGRPTQDQWSLWELNAPGQRMAPDVL